MAHRFDSTLDAQMHTFSEPRRDTDSPLADSVQPTSQDPSLGEMPTLLAVLQSMLLQPSSSVEKVEESATAHKLAWLVLTSMASSQPSAEHTQTQRSTLAHNNALLAEELAALHAGTLLLHIETAVHRHHVTIITDYESALTCIRELQDEIAVWKDRDAQWVKRDTTWQARDASWAKREARWNTRDAYWQRQLKEAREREANHLAELRRQRAMIDRMTLRMRRLQALHQQHIQQHGSGGHEFLDTAATGMPEDEGEHVPRRTVLPAWNAGFDLKGFVQPLPPGMTINNTPTTMRAARAMPCPRRLVVRCAVAAAVGCRVRML